MTTVGYPALASELSDSLSLQIATHAFTFSQEAPEGIHGYDASKGPHT